MKRYARTIALFVCTGCLAAAGTISLVSNRVDFTATDSVNWGTQGAEFDVKTGGASVGGDNFSLSGAAALTLFSGGTFAADFLATDTVLAAADLSGTGAIPGSIRLTFATPIHGAGAQIQISDFDVAFTAQLEAFGVGNLSLGTVTVSGKVNNPALGDGSAPFIGLRSDLADIVAIEFRTGQDGSAINNVTIGDVAAATPEPSTFILTAGLALFGMLGARRGKRTR